MDVVKTPHSEVIWIGAAVRTEGGTEEQDFTKPKPATPQGLFASHSNRDRGLSGRNFQHKHVVFLPSEETIALCGSTYQHHWLICLSLCSQTRVRWNKPMLSEYCTPAHAEHHTRPKELVSSASVQTTPLNDAVVEDQERSSTSKEVQGTFQTVRLPTSLLQSA